MSLDGIKNKVRELESAANQMSNALSSNSDWNDNVQQSYYRFTEEIGQSIRGLDYECESVINKARNAFSVNADKYKSELNSYMSRLGGI